MLVFLDSSEENLVPELALQCEEVLPDRWNGWARPIASAEAFGAFLDAWRSNDPNGTWGYATPVGDVLVCSRVDDDWPADEFPMAGTAHDGRPLYDFTGWAWIVLDEEPAQTTSC